MTINDEEYGRLVHDDNPRILAKNRQKEQA
jgi:hypothetical protein